MKMAATQLKTRRIAGSILRSNKIISIWKRSSIALCYARLCFNDPSHNNWYHTVGRFIKTITRKFNLGFDLRFQPGVLTSGILARDFGLVFWPRRRQVLLSAIKYSRWGTVNFFFKICFQNSHIYVESY